MDDDAYKSASDLGSIADADIDQEIGIDYAIACTSTVVGSARELMSRDSRGIKVIKRQRRRQSSASSSLSPSVNSERNFYIYG